jgi:hypothetical protein
LHLMRHAIGGWLQGGHTAVARLLLFGGADVEHAGECD